MLRIKNLLKNRPAIIFTSILMILVTALFIFYSSKLSIRLDESQSLWQTSRTYPRMLQIISQDVHVPLYHTLLHIWQSIFGNEVVLARLMSFILFVPLIPLMYYVTSKIYKNKNIVYLATLLVALSPFFNWYSSEVRMYSLFTLVTFLNQFFFLQFLNSSSKSRAVGYIITGILGIYTHYFFALTLFVQGLFYVTHFSEFKKGSFIRLATAAVAVFVAILPWLIFVKSQGSASNTQPLLQTPTSIDLFNTFSQFIFGFQDDTLNTLILSLWPIAVILAFIFISRRIVSVKLETRYFILAGLVPILLVFFVAVFFRPIYVSRYLIFTLPSIYIVLSVIISKYYSVLRNIITTTLLLLILAFFSVQIASPKTPVKENYLGAARYIESQVTVRDVVVLSTPFSIYPFEYYYKGPTPINTLPRWSRAEQGSIPAFTMEKLEEDSKYFEEGHEKMWLLLSYDQGYEEDIRIFFDTRYERLEKIEFSQDLTLYVYKLNYLTLKDPITI
jgi:mannosyltransferase